MNDTANIKGNDHGAYSGVKRYVTESQSIYDSSLIDNTEYYRSLAAIGQEFNCLHDNELSNLHTLNNASNTMLQR